MHSFKHIKLKSGKYLLSQTFKPEPSTTKTTEPAPTHHIFIIDCSGSMWGELSTIRKDLYNKISTLMRPQDAVSILWFSDKGQFGVLVEDYTIKSDTSKINLKKLIDDQLTPRGLTAFREPILEAKNIIEGDRKRHNNGRLYSLFFLTDGHDNRWSESDILEAVSDIAPDLCSASIIEYGYYCNKELLNKMATEVGGVHIFAEDFQDYEPHMERQFTQKIASPRQYIQLSASGIDSFAFSYDENGNVISYIVNDANEIFIDPKSVGSIHYITNSVPRTSTELLPEDYNTASQDPHVNLEILHPMYAAMVAYSKKSDFKTISDILKILGDSYFIIKKANTFGTQKINELEQEFATAIVEPSNMFRDGYNPDLEPAEDAYCVMDMIDDLMSDIDNKWYPSFMKYRRMSRKTELKGFEISQEDRDRISVLLSENKLEEIKSVITEIENNQLEKVEFINEDLDSGFSISNLTWNNKRANLSVQVYYKGYVMLPDNKFDTLPSHNKFNTGIFRNYNIIKDGVIHTYVLPVSLSENTFRKLQANGLLKGQTYDSKVMYMLDFSNLPVINQKMVRDTSAEELFRNHYELTKLKAKNSVFNYYKNRYLDGVSKTFIDLYGEEATIWLKELGITSNGFNPPVKQALPTEEILVNTMEVKIDKLSSLPSAKSVVEKMENGKPVTDRERIMVPYINEFQEFYKLVELVKNEEGRKNMIQLWIEAKSENIRKEKSALENSISRAKFLAIVGKSWFNDLSSREDKELTLEVDQEERKFLIEDKMTTIKI